MICQHTVCLGSKRLSNAVTNATSRGEKLCTFTQVRLMFGVKRSTFTIFNLLSFTANIRAVSPFSFNSVFISILFSSQIFCTCATSSINTEFSRSKTSLKNSSVSSSPMDCIEEDSSSVWPRELQTVVVSEPSKLNSLYLPICGTLVLRPCTQLEGRMFPGRLCWFPISLHPKTF